MGTPKVDGFRAFVVMIDIERVVEDLDNSDNPVDFSELSPGALLMKATSPEAAAEAAAKHEELSFEDTSTRTFIVCDLSNKCMYKYNITHQGYTIDEVD